MLHIWKNTNTSKTRRERGGKREYKKRDWSSERIAYVIENYYKMTRKEIADALGTTVHDIGNIVSKIRENGGLPVMKRKDLTKEEMSFIDKNIGAMSVRQIAKKLGKRDSVVCGYLEYTRDDSTPSRVVKRPDEIEEELDYVLRNYHKKTSKEMARELGVATHIIYLRVKALRDRGLLAKRKTRMISEDKIQYIIENKDRMTALEIAEEIGVSRVTVYKYIKRAKSK